MVNDKDVVTIFLLLLWLLPSYKPILDVFTYSPLIATTAHEVHVVSPDLWAESSELRD